jgi:hypothetical protein
MATWTIVDTELGVQPIALTSTTKNHPLGKIVRAFDSATNGQGGGEFIYLLGVANTLAGLVVTYNATTFQTTLLANTANLGNPIAIAMSANVASQYGWYQIEGNAVVLKSAVAVTPQAKVYVSGTTGRLMPTSASGKQVLGAKFANLATVTSTTSTVNVLISRPTMQGQIT